MSRSHTSDFTIEWGDCDAAGVVFYPNFFRWMDAAAHRFFDAAGLPDWRELEAATGILGAPLVDASAHFVRPGSYGDRIAIDTSFVEWRGPRLVLKHVVRRGADVLAEGQEIRVFARRHPEDARRMQAVIAPESIRRLLE